MKIFTNVILLLFTVLVCRRYTKMKADKEIAEFNCRMKIFKASSNTPPVKDEL